VRLQELATTVRYKNLSALSADRLSITCPPPRGQFQHLPRSDLSGQVFKTVRLAP
jgi:hypothetical protein